MDQLTNINTPNNFTYPNQLGNVGARSESFDNQNWQEREPIHHRYNPQELFGVNLALDSIAPADLQSLGQELKELVNADWESAADWRKILTMALEYLGIGTKGLNSKQSDALGNSEVFSGAFLESVLKGNAQLILDFFSQSKIIDIKVRDGIKEAGQFESSTDDVAAKLNYYLSRVDEGFLDDKQIAGMWLILAGCIFEKVWFDPIEKMVMARYVKPSDIIVDFSHSSLHDCPRISHRFTLTEREYKRYVEDGIYRKVELSPNLDKNSSALEKGVNRTSGTQPSKSDLEKSYSFIESQCYYSFPDLDGEKRAVPYRVTYAEETGDVVAVYFDWKQSDSLKKRKKLYTLIKYQPGFGLYGYGQAHIALNFAVLATNLLRESVTAAQLSNFPYAYVSDDVETPQSTTRPAAGDLIRLKTLGSTNMSQLFYSPPFKSPDQSILDFINKAEGNIESLSLATNMKIEDLQTNAPVGTTLALLMEWHRLPSCIMIRIYRSLCQEFSLIYDLLAETLPYQGSGQPPAQWGPYEIYADELLPIFEMLPIVDPNMTSTTLKLLMYDKMIEMSAAYPQFHNTYKLIKNYYELIKVPNIDEILINPSDAASLTSYNPVTENSNAMEGKPLKVEITDDHPSHIEVHMQEYGAMQQNELLADKAPALHAHIVEHLCKQYLIDMQNKMGMALPTEEQQQTPEEKNQIAMVAAQVVSQQQAQEQTATPPDPQLIAAQAEMRVAESEAENNHLRHQVDLLKVQIDEQRLQLDARIEELKAQSEAYKTQANMVVKTRELELKEQEFLHKIGASPGEQEVKNLDSIDPNFIPHPQ